VERNVRSSSKRSAKFLDQKAKAKNGDGILRRHYRGNLKVPSVKQLLKTNEETGEEREFRIPDADDQVIKTCRKQSSTNTGHVVLHYAKDVRTDGHFVRGTNTQLQEHTSP
jgi:hypothetical protein